MKIGVFAADDRMIHLCDFLKKEAEVIMIDENDSISELNRIAQAIDVLVFPVRGIDDTGFVRMKQRGLYVLDMLSHLKKDCVIFSGQESSLFKAMKHKVICWLKDDEVLIRNAELTAQGILGYLLMHSLKSRKQIKIDLIGTGRCAKACAESFDSLNLSYRMVTRQLIHHPDYIDLDSWKTSDPYDIIVNTAPSCIVDQNVLDHWKNRKLVVDISTGFVFVSDSCRKHPFLNLVELKAIPAQVAPSTAAEIIGEYILKELKQ